MRLAEWVRAQQPETVEQVAARLGVGRVALHRLMRGQTFPCSATRQAIAREACGAVTLGDLQDQYNEYYGMVAA